MVQVLVELSYEQIIEVVDKLPRDQKRELLTHLMMDRPTNDTEWWALVEEAHINIPVIGAYSDRRDDWYDDDGR